MPWVDIANLKGAPGDIEGLQILQDVLDKLDQVEANQEQTPRIRGSADGLDWDLLFDPVQHAGYWDVTATGGGRPWPNGITGNRALLRVVGAVEFAVQQYLISRDQNFIWTRTGVDVTVTPPVWSQWSRLAGDAESVLRTTSDGVPRSLDIDDPDYVTVELSQDYRRIGGQPRYIAPDGKDVTSVLPYLDGAPVVMDKDFRRMQPGADATGLTPQWVLDEWAGRMQVGLGLSTLTGWGDSMTTDYGTTGTTTIGLIAEELGVDFIDQGRAGNTQVEIAWRMGALRWGVTVTGGSIPATGAVAATINPGPGFRNAYTWDCYVMDRTGTRRAVRLRSTAPAQMGGTPTWTIEQIGGTTAITLLPDTRIWWNRPAGQDTLPCTIWIGRNDSEDNPGSIDRAVTALDAMLTQHRDPLRRRIVLPVWNRATEPAGSEQYELVMAMNEAMAERAGADWFDLRAAIIRDGLDIVGLTPTAEDTAAIAADQVPPSLMTDITHPNVLGKTAIARIVGNEIRGRNW